MSPAAHIIPDLLAQLSRAIGHESARIEFRWMTQTLDRHPPGIPPSTQNIAEMLSRRIAGEPLQYILGSQPFGPLNIAVRPPVLIPRPETEDWTIRLAELLSPSPSPSRPFKLLDLCTGTGCIPLLLCHLWPPGTVHAIGVDISPTAVTLAKHNAALSGFSTPRDIDDGDQVGTRPPPSIQNRLSNVYAQENCHSSNTFTATLADLMHPSFVTQARLQPQYDLITSNPPYISKAEYDDLSASVKDYEDTRALLGDLPDTTFSPSVSHIPVPDRAKGLTFYHRIAALVREFNLLRPGGTLALEVGAGQSANVAAILKNTACLHDIDVWRDPWGKNRVVVART